MPTLDLKNPPPEPVWWTAVHGNSTCHVFTRLWYDAREIASAELGADVEVSCDVEVDDGPWGAT